MNYRISISPINPSCLRLKVEKVQSVGAAAFVIADCKVEFSKGCVSTTPWGETKTFGWPEEIDEQVRSLVRAYYDGMNGSDGFAWIFTATPN